MSDIMRPIPFTELIERVFTEYRNQGSIFGIRKENFYRGDKNQIDVFGQKCSTPVGPAAGPHTQLAQNIISSYLVGGRFIELKTVQIMDYLGEKKMISKPCIDARDEGFNVEWSTEFTLEKAYDEYLKAWIVVNLLQALLNGTYDKPNFIFNMSVGYNLEGIRQPKMQTFIDSLINAETNPLFSEYKEQLSALIGEEEFYTGSDFEKNSKVLTSFVEKIPANICRGVTVSTMHGCPPEEIEAICSYMLIEKHLNTFVKLNPTLLGYEKVRNILDTIGFDYIQLKPETFEHDLQLKDAFVMLHKLVDLAKSLNLGFGVKLTNTLANVNNENIFEGDERYMSGRALLPISTCVASILSEEFNGHLPVSYSGGANLYSVLPLFECGIRPITLATDMLKPGGYTRLKAMAELLNSSKKWNMQGVDCAGIKKLSEDFLKTEYTNKAFRGTDRAKTESALPLFDCFVSPCQEACPIHQSIPDYVQLVSEGRYVEALDLIYGDNALANITCNICDHQCQYHCARMDYDGAVEIRNAKKLAVENGLKDYLKTVKSNSVNTDFKVAIVGAGPAGLSAAYFLLKNGIDTTLFEKEKNAGGVVANIIPKFRISPETIKADIDVVEKLGAKFVFGVDKKDETIEALKKKGFDYIIYAVGSEIGNAVKIDGDTSKVIDGLDFLRLFNENKAQLGKHVVIEGAGNSAMDCARAAIRVFGVESVSVVYRRSIKEMPASYEEYQEACRDGVKFFFLTNPKSLDNSTLHCCRMALGEVDSSGRRKPVETEEFVDLVCDNLILSVGEHVDSDLVSSFGVPLNDKGWPEVDIHNETKVPDVFAVGDMATGPSTVVRCIAEARKAADCICEKIGCEIDDVEEVYDEELTDEEFFEREDRFFEDLFKRKSVIKSHSCLNCSYLCLKCVDVCPNRANVAVDMRGSENSVDAYQVVHIDAYCNECGNCATFCNHAGRPYKDKFTVFSRPDDFEASTNSGFYAEGNSIKVRNNGSVVECRIDGNGSVVGDIPDLMKDLIEEIFISYGYLLGRVDE